MDLDKQLAEHLAAWGRTRRGWDKAGTLACLARVRGRAADDVAMAWIRFCADEGVNSPGAFPNLAGPHWTEKVAPPTPPRNPRPGEACTVCGQHYDRCLCRGGPTIRVHMPAANAPARKALLAEIAAQRRAELCPCGIAPNICLIHKHIPTEETP